MKVRYVFPVKPPLRLLDHWPVPLLGGECRLVEEEGLVTGVEFTKSGLSTDLAFTMIDTPDEVSKATITGNDDFLPVVRDHITRAFSFLQCFFNTGISLEEVQIHHEAENADEDSKIAIPSFHMGKVEQRPLPLSYDMFTRSLMAAGEYDGPEFVSSLATMAREALIAKRYIESFRFSFLLFESLFGGGKFKSHQLKAMFLASPDLLSAIQHGLDEWPTQTIKVASDTSALMSGSPTMDQIVAHLIAKRGHYFHGNLVKKDAWSPAKQDEAEALAIFSQSVASVISANAASPMFDDKYAKRHFEEAALNGAHVVMEINFFFRMPEDDFIRTKVVNFKMPGTKPTTPMVTEAAWRALQNFRENMPVGRLHSVRATNAIDGSEVFHIRILTEVDGQVVEG